MKRFLSILLSALLLLSVPAVGFTAAAAETKERTGTENFINGIVELSREYDANKEFVLPEEMPMTFSIEDVNASESHSLLDFQTARLIVRANGNFNTYGAKKHVNGFEDFHILQYESPKAAQAAYAKLLTSSGIREVTPDAVVSPLQGDTMVKSTKLPKAGEHLCPWSCERTQSNYALDYLKEHNVQMQEVVVAVIDDGVYYDNGFLKNRLIRTHFNSSDSGDKNDEYATREGHGTAVGSVIVDNTTDNVKIAAYKVLNNKGQATMAQIAAAILKATEDEVDIINMSLGYFDDSNLTVRAILKAYQQNIPVFTATGNESSTAYQFVPANIPQCIAVTSTDSNNIISDFSNVTMFADVSAPGEEINVTLKPNEYAVWSGTSFSAPCTAALGALIKSTEPNITVDELTKRIKDTASPVKETENFSDGIFSSFIGKGLIQFADALGIPALPEFKMNLETKPYLGAQSCVFSCADQTAQIFYTTDGTYPAKDNPNAMQYTEPFEMTERKHIRAVAFFEDQYYSREIEKRPRIQYVGAEKDFEITPDGVITSYHGEIRDLLVPETINGIAVTGITENAFYGLIGLTLPDTVKEIPENAFFKDSFLEYIRADGVENIGNGAFEQAENLLHIEFPNVRTIGEYSFNCTISLVEGIFPKAECIGRNAFENSAILQIYAPQVKTIGRAAFKEAYLEYADLSSCEEIPCSSIEQLKQFAGEFASAIHLISLKMPKIKSLYNSSLKETAIREAVYPFLESIGTKAFYDCICLEKIDMPLLKAISKEGFSGESGAFAAVPFAKPRKYYFPSVTTIGTDAFGNYETEYIEFSSLKTADSLPKTEGCMVVMPSTFESCTEDTKGRNYHVYGTSGTAAEAWAKENGHEFIELSQDTAILEDVQAEYTYKDEVLTMEVAGFHKTYQWYASNSSDGANGTPIDGATAKEFKPSEHKAYPYYYCVVTSTDEGCEPIEIRTGVCVNRVDKADYSVVETAKMSIPENLNLYTDESVQALNKALSAVEYSLPITEQKRVETFAKNIEVAVRALAYKAADYATVEAAKARIPSDLTIYTEESVKNLNAVLAEIDRSLNITEQATVDAYAEAILAAIEKLQLKPVPEPIVPTEPEESTEPETPSEPVQPTTPSVPSAEVDTETPNIPKTGKERITISMLCLLTTTGIITTVLERKKQKNK